MPQAPLQVTVEIELESGPASGERRFRLSREIELPPLLHFACALPLEGEGAGRVRFTLPDGQRLEAAALLFSDPEHPERGSSAALRGLRLEQLQAIQGYVERRLEVVER